MRIFLVSNMYPSAESKRFGVFVKNVEMLLQEAGAEFSHKAYITYSANVFAKTYSYLAFFLKILYTGFFKNNYDFIYAHFPLQSAPVLLFVQIITGKSILLNFHGSDVSKKGILNKVLFPFQKLLVKKARLLVVPSQTFMHKTKQHFGLKDVSKFYVYPSGGVDGKVFKVEQAHHNEERKYTVGYISSILEAKGWRTYLEALEILQTRGIGFSAVLIGSGLQSALCDKLIKEKGLEKKLVRIAEIEQKQLASYFQEIDLFVFPTKSESLGLIAIEAMYCAVPVLASDLEITQEYILEGKNGFLAATNNSAIFAERIERYMQLPKPEKIKMRKFAQEFAQKYDAQKSTEAFFNHLQTLLANA